MKVELAKDEFHERLSLVEKLCGKQVTLPVLRGVYLEASEGSLLLRATNLDVGVEITLAAKVERTGVVVVPASILLQLLGTLNKGGRVSLEVEAGHMKVTGGASTTNINILDSEEYPKLPRVTDGVASTIAASDLVVGLRSVMFAASHSTIKPELASVYVYSDGDAVTFVATDSFRLAEKRIRPKKRHAEGSFLLPVRNVPEVMRIMEVCEGEVELAYTANQLSLVTENVYLTSRLVDGMFPDYTQIIPKDFASEIIVLQKDLQASLKKASIFADAFNQVRFSIEPHKKKITISAASSELGDVEEVLSGTIEGETLAASFNQRYLLDSFQGLGGDSITCSFSGQGKPMIMKSVSDDSFLYLVMPMNK